MGLVVCTQWIRSCSDSRSRHFIFCITTGYHDYRHDGSGIQHHELTMLYIHHPGHHQNYRHHHYRHSQHRVPHDHGLQLLLLPAQSTTIAAAVATTPTTESTETTAAAATSALFLLLLLLLWLVLWFSVLFGFCLSSSIHSRSSDSSFHVPAAS